MVIFWLEGRKCPEPLRARKGDKECELFVNIVPAENPIKVEPVNILIDNIREYPINLTSVFGKKTYKINPAAFVGYLPILPVVSLRME